MKTFKKILLGLLLLVSTVGNAQWTGIGNSILIKTTFQSEPWNIDNASLVTETFLPDVGGYTLSGIFFRQDEEMFYFTDRSSQEIHQYSIVAGAVSTLTHIRSVSVSAQVTGNIYGVSFKNDGTIMIVLDQSGVLYQYSLSTGWNISTRSFVKSKSIVGTNPEPVSLYILFDGTKLYTSDNSNDNMSQYNFGTAWDIDTISFIGSESVSSHDGAPRQLYVRDDGDKVFIVGLANNILMEWDIGTSFIISTSTYLKEISSFTSQSTGVFFNTTGTKMYLTSTGFIREFNL